MCEGYLSCSSLVTIYLLLESLPPPFIFSPSLLFAYHMLPAWHLILGEFQKILKIPLRHESCMGLSQKNALWNVPTHTLPVVGYKPLAGTFHDAFLLRAENLIPLYSPVLDTEEILSLGCTWKQLLWSLYLLPVFFLYPMEGESSNRFARFHCTWNTAKSTVVVGNLSRC